MTTGQESEITGAVSCAECGRKHRTGETWRILFADRAAREAVTYCPECAEREFGGGTEDA